MECYFFECTHVCNRYNIIDHNGGKKNKKMYFLFLKIAFSSLSNSSLYHDTTRHGLYFLSASNQLPTNLTRPEKSISYHTWPKSSMISDHPSKYYHNFSDRRRTATDFKYWALNYSPLIIKIYLLQNNAFYSRVQKTAVIIIRVGISVL